MSLKKEVIVNFFILLSYCYLFLLTPIFASNPSNLDTSFNSTGSATHLFIANTINRAQEIAVQPDGKIVSVGYAGDNAIIVRYNNNGTLDTTFNSTSQQPGSIIVTLGTQSAVYAVALEPATHKIIVAGYATINAVDNAFIARYNKDGTLDTTFNGSGYVTTVFRAQSQLFTIKLQPDGNIVVAGWATYHGFTNALIARYTSAGILDTTFNTTGYVTTLLGGVFTKARALEIQTDGNIVIVGQAQIDGVQQLIIFSYASDGSIDGSFNNDTGYNIPLSSFLMSTGYGIALQADQKIVIVGATNAFDLGFDNQLYTTIRLNNDGTLDTTFNAGDTPGFIIASDGLQANGVVVQSNGQIVTCGFSFANNYVVIVIRYNSDGTVDPTFNFTINNAGSNSIGNAIAIQPTDGKIVVSGAITTPYTGS